MSKKKKEVMNSSSSSSSSSSSTTSSKKGLKSIVSSSSSSMEGDLSVPTSSVTIASTSPITAIASSSSALDRLSLLVAKNKPTSSSSFSRPSSRPSSSSSSSSSASAALEKIFSKPISQSSPSPSPPTSSSSQIRSLFYLSPDDKDNIPYLDNTDNRLSPLHEDNENVSINSRYTKSPNSQISPSQRSPIHINENDLDLSLLSNDDIYTKESYTVGQHVSDTTNEIIELQKIIEGSTSSLEKAYLDIKILESKLEIEEATTKNLKNQIKEMELKEEATKLEHDAKEMELAKVVEERIRSQSAENVAKEKSIASDYEEKLLDYAKKLAVEVINSKKLRDQIRELEYDQRAMISEYDKKLLDMFNSNSKTIATYKERIESYEDNLDKMSKSIVVSAQIERKEIDHMVSEYDTEIDSMRAEHADNTKKLTAIYEAQLTMVKDENTLLVNEVASYESQLTVARSQIKDLELDGNRFKNKCEALTEEVSRLEGNIVMTNADSNYEVVILKEKISALESAINSLQRDHESVLESNDKYVLDIQLLRNTLNAQHQDLTDKELSLVSNLTNLESDYNNLKNKLADNAIDISTMKTTISDLKSQRDTQDAKVLKLKQEVNDLKVTNASSEATKEDYKNQINSLKKSIEELTTTSMANEKHIDILEKTIENHDNNVVEKVLELSKDYETKIEGLQNNIKEYLQQIESYEKEIDKHKDTIKESETSIAEYEIQINSMKEILVQKDAHIVEQEEKIISMTTAMADCDDKLTGLKKKEQLMTQEFNELLLLTNSEHERLLEENEQKHQEAMVEMKEKFERQMNYAKSSHNKVLKDNLENFKLEYGDALEATLLQYEKKILEVETENTCILEKEKYLKLDYEQKCQYVIANCNQRIYDMQTKERNIIARYERQLKFLKNKEKEIIQKYELSQHELEINIMKYRSNVPTCVNVDNSFDPTKSKHVPISIEMDEEEYDDEDNDNELTSNDIIVVDSIDSSLYPKVEIQQVDNDKSVENDNDIKDESVLQLIDIVKPDIEKTVKNEETYVDEINLGSPKEGSIKGSIEENHMLESFGEDSNKGNNDEVKLFNPLSDSKPISIDETQKVIISKSTVYNHIAKPPKMKSIRTNTINTFKEMKTVQTNTTSEYENERSRIVADWLSLKSVQTDTNDLQYYLTVEKLQNSSVQAVAPTSDDSTQTNFDVKVETVDCGIQSETVSSEIEVSVIGCQTNSNEYCNDVGVVTENINTSDSSCQSDLIVESSLQFNSISIGTSFSIEPISKPMTSVATSTTQIEVKDVGILTDTIFIPMHVPLVTSKPHRSNMRASFDFGNLNSSKQIIDNLPDSIDTKESADASTNTTFDSLPKAITTSDMGTITDPIDIRSVTSSTPALAPAPAKPLRKSNIRASFDFGNLCIIDTRPNSKFDVISANWPSENTEDENSAIDIVGSDKSDIIDTSVVESKNSVILSDKIADDCVTISDKKVTFDNVIDSGAVEYKNSAICPETIADGIKTTDNNANDDNSRNGDTIVAVEYKNSVTWPDQIALIDKNNIENSNNSNGNRVVDNCCQYDIEYKEIGVETDTFYSIPSGEKVNSSYYITKETTKFISHPTSRDAECMTSKELLLTLLEDQLNNLTSKQNSPHKQELGSIADINYRSKNDIQALSPTSMSSGSYDSGGSFSIITSNNTNANSRTAFDKFAYMNEKLNNDNNSYSSDDSKLPVIVRDSRSVVQLQRDVGMKTSDIVDDDIDVFLQASSSSLSFQSNLLNENSKGSLSSLQQHINHLRNRPDIQQILLLENKRRDIEQHQLIKRLTEYTDIISELGGKYEIMSKKMNVHKLQQPLQSLLSKLKSASKATTDSSIHSYISNHINNNYMRDPNNINSVKDDKSTVSSIDVNVGNDDDEFTIPHSANSGSNTIPILANNRGDSKFSNINKFSTLALMGYDNDIIAFVEHELKDKDCEIGKLNIYVKEYSDIIASLTNEYNSMIAELAKIDPNTLQWYDSNTNDSNTIKTSKSNPDVKASIDGPKPSVRSSVSITESANSYKYTKIQKLWDGVQSKYMNYDSDDASTQKVVKGLMTKFEKVNEGPNYKFPKPPKYWEQNNKDIVFRNEPAPFGQDAHCLVDMKKEDHYDRQKKVVEIDNDSSILEKPFWSRGCGNPVPPSSWLSNNRNSKQDINKNLYYDYHKLPGRPSSEQSYKKPGRKISSYVNDNASIIAQDIEKKRKKEREMKEKMERKIEMKEYMEKQALLQNIAKHMNNKK